jgi:hypothetical protein
MIRSVLCISFNDYPSSHVRGTGRAKYATELGLNWIDFKFDTSELIDSKQLIKKLNCFYKLRSYINMKKTFKKLDRIIIKGVDIIFLVSRPDDILLNYLRTLNIPKVYDFDDPLYLDEFRMPKSFLKDLAQYNGIVVDNELEVNVVYNYNKNVISIPGISPVGKNLKDNDKEFQLIWVGTKSTSIYIRKFTKTFQRILNEYPNFKIVFLGLDGDELNLNHERVKYVPKYDEKDIIIYCGKSDVGFYPTFDNQLGIHRGPHKIHVYLSCGLPAVAKGNALTRKVLKPEYGFIFDTEEELEKILKQLIIDNSLIKGIKSSIKNSYDGDALNRASTTKLINFFQNITKADA